MSEPFSPGLGALFEVVRRLRAPGGCPWDREQTHESLRPYLLEETYEALEAIDQGDDEKLKEELGDVLLQVAMHAEIASESGRFDAAAVSEATAAKMVARHPHVFGDEVAADAEQVLANWEKRKRREVSSSGRSPFDSVPRALPALARAAAVQTRAARNGVAEPPLSDVVTLVKELESATDQATKFTLMGEILFALVRVARASKIEPEDALRVATLRFEEQVL